MLISERIIVESNGDLEIVSTIVAGFDIIKNFVVQYHFEDYRKDGKDFSYSALVDEEEAKVMASHLEVAFDDLPQALYNEFGDTTGLSVPSEVESIFKDILEYILDSGAKYTLKR